MTSEQILMYTIFLILLLIVIVYFVMVGSQTYKNNKKDNYKCRSAFNGCGTCINTEGCSRCEQCGIQARQHSMVNNNACRSCGGQCKTMKRDLKNYIQPYPYDKTKYTTYSQQLPSGGAYYSVGK